MKKIEWVLMSGFRKFICIFIALAIIFPACILANEASDIELFVSLSGNDQNIGNIDSPLKTLEEAKSRVREINENMTSDIIIYLREGVYSLDSTFTLTNLDSGSNGYNVIYKSYNNENAVISGGKRLNGWEKKDNLWQIDVSDITDMRMVLQLYVNGRKARRAQPEAPFEVVSVYDDKDDDTYERDGIIVSSPDFKDYKNPTDIQLHFPRGWRDILCNVTSIKRISENEVFIGLMQPLFNDSAANPATNHPIERFSSFFLENAMEELDREGEFYYNNSTKMLYYLPREDEDMSTAEIYAPVLEKVIEIKGESLHKKAKNIVFDGLTIAHGTWYRQGEVGLLINQTQEMIIDKATATLEEPGRALVPANIQINGAEFITFKNNVIKFMGCVGIGLYNGVNYSNFTGNVFEDIVDSAMTVGMPSHSFTEPECEGFNHSYNKAVSACSIYPNSHEVEKGNDAIIDTGWSPASEDTDMHWWQIDLGKPTRLTKIEIDARPSTDQPDTRRNFEVIGSNDEEFKAYSVLASVGSIPFENGKTCELYVSDDSEYRYIQIRKTVNEYFYLAEVRLIDENIPYVPQKEICKYNKIQNNYINRAGDGHWGAPGIQSFYVQGLDISHNELYDLPYSGICSGWGWENNPGSTTSRDNSINFNRIDKYTQVSFDGGGVYTLGNQPNTTIIGNYFSNQFNYPGTIYMDAGSKYYTIMDNVSEYIVISHFPNERTTDMTFKNNYSTAPHYTHNNEACVIEEPEYFVPNNPTKPILDIMSNAGITPEYIHIKDKATERMWEISDELLYNNAAHEINYNTLNDDKFNTFYLKKMIESAQKVSEAAIIGDDVGQYTKEVYGKFMEAIELATAASKVLPINRFEVSRARHKLLMDMKEFAAGRNVLTVRELLEKTEELSKSLTAGYKLGECPPDLYESFLTCIKKLGDNPEDEYSKLYLETYLKEVEKGIITLDIRSFNISGQMGKAEISDGNIILPIKYIADASEVFPNIEASENIKITPPLSDPIDLNRPVKYTLSTLDGEHKKDWIVSVRREAVTSSNEAYPLDDVISDTENWKNVSSVVKNYSGKLFGNITLAFNMKIKAVEDDWPSITFRNRDSDLQFSDRGSEGYIIVFTPENLEFYRFNDGERTEFYGNFAGLIPKVDYDLSPEPFKFDSENKIELTTVNESAGVRIILNINGKEVFNVLDSYEGAIRNPGYFGTTSPKTDVILSKIGSDE